MGSRNVCHEPPVVITVKLDEGYCQSFASKLNTYGVPSGPVINALMISTRVSSTLRKMEEPQDTGKFVVRIANCSLRLMLNI